jgi:hypothetical protein
MSYASPSLEGEAEARSEEQDATEAGHTDPRLHPLQVPGGDSSTIS